MERLSQGSLKTQNWGKCEMIWKHQSKINISSLKYTLGDMSGYSEITEVFACFVQAVLFYVE